jgi:O-antigen/teichoic acid export membrane protein
MTQDETSKVPIARERSLLFSGAHTVATNVLQAIGALGIAALIARALGPEGKGEYDLYVTTSNLMIAVLGLSLTSGIAYVTARRIANIPTLVRYFGIFGLIQGAAAASVVLLVKGNVVGAAIIPRGLSDWAPLLIGLSVCALAVSSMLRAVLSGQRRFVAANHRDLAKQLIGLCALAAALAISNVVQSSRLQAAVIANVFTILSTALLYYVATKADSSDNIAGSGLGECFKFAIPSYFGNMVQFLNYRVDVFFVNSLAGTGQLGIYQSAVLLAQSLRLIPSAAQAVLFPTVAKGEGSREAAGIQIARANRLLMLVSVAGGSVLAVGGGWCVHVMFGPEFQGGVTALLWLIPGTVLFTTCTVLAAYFSGIGKPQINLVSALSGLCITIPLDLVLIPRFGIRGAAVASSVSYAVSAGVTALFFVRETGIPLRRLFLADRDDFALIGRAIARVSSRTARGGWK